MNNSEPVSDLIVDTNWLADNLLDSSIRIIDTRVGFEPRPPGPSNFFQMKDEFLESHIPGSTYLHMVDDLSDPEGLFPFAMPHQSKIWKLLSLAGINNQQTIVLYGNAVTSSTHRCWWVLKNAGVQDVRLLDINFEKWTELDMPVESGESRFPVSNFIGGPEEHWTATKQDVIDSLDDPKVTLVNSLSAEQFTGQGQYYGRPGRIPGSISVPANELIDFSSGKFREWEAISSTFERAGAHKQDKLITYCGGGIAASTTFFALHVLGFSNLSLYDGSLLEWSEDPDLPLEID